MIEAKEAAQIAEKYSTELFGDEYAISLEEVELSNDGASWYITLGYRVMESSSQSLSRSLGIPQPPDFYKVFEINRANGTVRSMKIRKVG